MKKIMKSFLLQLLLASLKRAVRHADTPPHVVYMSNPDRQKRSLPEVPLFMPPLKLSEFDPNPQNTYDAMQNHAVMYQDSLAFNNPLQPESMAMEKYRHRKYSIPNPDEYNPTLGPSSSSYMNAPQQTYISGARRMFTNEPSYRFPNPFLSMSAPQPPYIDQTQYHMSNNKYDEMFKPSFNNRPDLAFNRGSISKGRHHKHRKHHHRHHHGLRNYGQYQRPLINYQTDARQLPSLIDPPYEPTRPFMNEPQQSFANGRQQSFRDEPHDWRHSSLMNEPADGRQQPFRDERQYGRQQPFRDERQYGRQQPYEDEPRDERQHSFSDGSRDGRQQSFMNERHNSLQNEPTTSEVPHSYWDEQQYERRSPLPDGPQHWSQIPFMDPVESPRRSISPHQDYDNNKDILYPFARSRYIPVPPVHKADPTVADSPVTECPTCRDQVNSPYRLRSEIEDEERDFLDHESNPVDSLDGFAQALTARLQAENIRLRGTNMQGYEASHQAFDDEDPGEPHLRHHHHHHRRHHHHHRHHHHDEDMEQEGDAPPDTAADVPDATEADEEDDEEEEGPDDDDDDDDNDDDDDPGNDKKSMIIFTDGKAVKRSFNDTTSDSDNSTDITLGDTSMASNVGKDDVSPENIHIDELEDSKRSGIPSYAKEPNEALDAPKENEKNKAKEKEEKKEKERENITQKRQSVESSKNIKLPIRDTIVNIIKDTGNKRKIDELEDAKRSSIPRVPIKQATYRKIPRTIPKTISRKRF